MIKFTAYEQEWVQCIFTQLLAYLDNLLMKLEFYGFVVLVWLYGH